MNKITLNIKKTIPLIIHILFCVIILFIPLLVMLRNGETDYKFYSGYLIRMTCPIILFYINYLFLIDKFLFDKKFIYYLVINIILILGATILQDFLQDIIRSQTDMPEPPPMKKIRGHKPPPYGVRIISEYVFMVLFVGMSVALKVTMRWYKDSINLETIKATQLEANLRNLRSQLNPHFLFNTLNNIYSLVAIDTQKAQESIYRLSGLLRFVLYENNNKFIPIDKELVFTKNYIDLMALRLNPNVKLNVIIKNNGCNNEIASLMFMTLIENAFKHGISSDKTSYIDIKILVEKNKGVLCSVENSRNEDKDKIEAKNSGIGLANLQKRLELLYPHGHQFEIKKTDDKFSVLLRIDFDNN